MHPILTEVTVFGVTRPIGGYGVMVALGVLATAFVAAYHARREGEDVGSVIAAIGYTILGAFAGAWLLYLIVEVARGGSIAEALAHGGGLVFYGAVPTGAGAAWLACRGLGVPFAKMVDLTVPGIALGHALGRVGCFLGGCCYGAPTDGPVGVTFTHPMSPAAHPPVPRHPTQLYEATGLLLLAVVFASLPRAWLKPGWAGRTGLYLASYGVLRFVVEFFRGDAIRGVFGGLATSQLISLLGMTLGVALVFRARRLDRRGLAA